MFSVSGSRRLLAAVIAIMIALAASGPLAGEQTGAGLASTAQPAPGELDLTFSGDGKEITHMGGSGYGYAAIEADDGKVLVVGGAYIMDGAGAYGWDFALARYNPDGSLDTTFSSDGTQTTDFGGDMDHVLAVAIATDDKIVVVGRSGADLALARYNADGSLDTTFSKYGKLTTAFGGEGDAAYGAAIEAGPDGKIVAVGVTAGGDFAVARYNADGSLDTTFSNDGTQTTDFGGFDYAAAVAIRPGGKIVVAGTINTPPTCDGCGDSASNFAIAQYNADGSLDSMFSDGGTLTTDFGFGGEDRASSVAVQADGKIVVVGSSYVYHASAMTFALARYNPDGSLDATFGRGGLQVTQFEGSDWASGVALQPDGKIVVVGGGPFDARGEMDFALARYDPDGWLDPTFSDDGRQTTDFGGSDEASGVTLQRDGKIMAVGGTWGATGGGFALARYENGSGPSDATPPETTITDGPMGAANVTTPTFSFVSSELGSTFKCRVDDGVLSPCNSPHTTSTLSDGPHTFEVGATDAAGNADPSPATRVFTVDMAPPETTITNGPTGTTHDSTATFSFESSEGGSTFECRVNDSVFSPCSSPSTTSPLSDGSHSFQVRATDDAGNVDPTPASRSWLIVPDYRTVVLATSGLVSYWRLGETSATTAADAKGANNGSYRNGVLLDRPSALLNDSNASASFDGSNDYVSVADNASLDTRDSFTLEAWVKRSGTSSATKTVLSKGNGSYRLSFVDNVLTLTKSNSGTITRASVATTDTTGFHHVVATKSGATLRLYIDGVDRTGAVTNRTIANTSTALNIGRDTAGSEYFPGLIDEVAIYSVALSAAAVHQHFMASGR